MQVESPGRADTTVKGARDDRPLSPPPRPAYTTVRGAAAYTGISQAKLYELMKGGHLAFAKVDKMRRIAFADLDALMRRHTVATTVGTPTRN